MRINKNTLSIVFPAYLGTILEWYDFSIFAFFSPIISELFFPSSNQLASYLSIYAVFAVGFLVRPFGAAVFGHFGDALGRKKMLVISMITMSCSTVAIGLLPTYDRLGIISPLLLVLMRLIQGFCVGGETTGAAVFVLESLPNKSRGLLGALMWSAVGLGMLLSSLVTTIITACLTQDNLNHFGWRIPFILGLFTGLIGYFFRKRLSETSLFTQVKQRGAITQLSTLSLAVNHKKSISIILGLYALSAMITYLVFVFMPFYASNVLHIPMATASLITTLAIAVVTVTIPFAGMLSDRYGRKPCLLVGSLGLLIVSYPLYALMASTQSLSSFLVSECIFVLFAFIYQGTLTTTAQEITLTPVRYTVTSLGYNLGYAIFGGTTPFVVTYLLSLSDNKAIPGLYLSFGSVLALFALLKVKETAKEKLL